MEDGILKFEEETTMELVNVEKALCDISRAEIKEMVSRFMSLKVIPDDKASYKTVSDAKNKFVHLRNDIDKKRKKLNEDAQADIKSRNDTAKELVALFSPAETHLANEVKAEDDRIAKIESDRIARIQGMITIITDNGNIEYDTPSDKLQQRIATIEGIIIDDKFEEFQMEASAKKESVLTVLNTAFAKRVQFEKEDAERAAEAARLKKIADEQEKERQRQAEAQKVIDEQNAKIAAEQKKIQDEKDRIAKDERAAFEKKEREEREARIREEARQQAIKDANAKAIREQKEKEAWELAEKKKAEKKAAMAPDREKLLKYAEALRALRCDTLKSEDAMLILAEANNHVVDAIECLLTKAEAL